MSKRCVCSISISDSSANTLEQNIDQIDPMIHSRSIILTNPVLRKKNDLPYVAHVEINVTFDSILFIFSRKVNHRRYFAEISVNENDLSVLRWSSLTHTPYIPINPYTTLSAHKERMWVSAMRSNVCSSSSNRQISHCAMSASLFVCLAPLRYSHFIIYWTSSLFIWVYGVFQWRHTLISSIQSNSDDNFAHNDEIKQFVLRWTA